MATVTKTFRENGGTLVDYSVPSEGATWTVSITGADYNVFNDSGLLEIADPTMTAKYVQYSSDAAKRRAYIDCSGQILINDVSFLGRYAYLTKRREDGAATSGTTYTIAKRSDSSFPFSVNLTKVFNANTPTLKTAAITLPSYSMWLESYYGGTASSNPTNDSYYQGSLSFGTIGYVYYKCPPELATCNILKDTPSGYYANYTTVTIEVPITYSSVSQSGTAKYGGYIKKIEATIGTESSVLTFDESTKPTSTQTLTLNPTIVGNDIPVSVTVTDSRDQNTTQSLGTINVLAYNKPSVGFDVYRTDNVGKKTDEGAYAIIDAQVTYTPNLTTIKQKPTIIIDGVDKTSSVTWYSSWTANGGIVSGSAISSWSSVSSGSKIYGLINNNFSDTNSYQISMVVTDTLNGTSDSVTQTLSTAFYTIDFQAGGKEIAFGAPANDDLTNINEKDYSENGLFKCRMHTLFEQNVNTNGDITCVNVIASNLVGEIKQYAGTTVPTGWLECDGSEVAVADYPLLYAAIGDLWGAPSDSDHFVLPNFKGKVPVGYDASQTEFDTVGESGGEKTHTLTEAQIPAHTHGARLTNGSIRLFKGNQVTTASGSISFSSVTKRQYKADGTDSNSWQTATFALNHTHDSVGGSGAHNNLQPYAVVKYIICAA